MNVDIVLECHIIRQKCLTFFSVTITSEEVRTEYICKFRTEILDIFSFPSPSISHTSHIRPLPHFNLKSVTRGKSGF